MPANKRGPVQLPLKLAGLFLAAFAFFFAIFFVYDLVSRYAAKSAMAVQANDQTKPVVIDPKLADDLAKVLALDANPSSRDVRDPFSDRAGLSGTVAAANALQTVMTTPTGSRTVVSAPANRASTSTPSNSSGANVRTPPTAAPVETTKDRYETWLGSVGLSGEAPLDPRLFAIEDLSPVGIVDGGSGQQEVLFFSQTVEKTISFPLGTMFFDGWLTELRPEGVVFSFNDERRTIRMRSWARSVKNSG